MYKFQFNLQTQTLKIVQADRFLVLNETWQLRALVRVLGGTIIFVLDHSEQSNEEFELPNHWIVFSVCKEKVKVLYKAPQKDGSDVYYQRELIRPSSGIVELEFSQWDQLEKKKGSKIKIKS